MIKKPMKGEQIEPADFHRIKFPIYASRKIDGFRCILGEEPLSSRLAPFRNPFVQCQLSGLLKDELLDGEIVVGSRKGKGVLQRTSSGVTNTAGYPDFTFWAFDAPQADQTFFERSLMTQRIVKRLGHPRIRYLRQRIIHDVDELQAYIDESLLLGYEGIVLKDPDGHYKEGKSSIRQGLQMKIKPFVDAEARVIGWYEEMHNTNEQVKDLTGKSKRSSAKDGKVPKGRLGGFILEGDIRVGGGFTEKQRIELWRIRETLRGVLVKYKKQAVGEKDKPRHTSFVDFLDFRPDWDYAA